MSLPLAPPVLPQLARSAKTLPAGEGWSYEPKWDGFRSIAFVDDGEVYLQSRNGRPLSRYFPELEFPAGRYVLDGEIVLFDEQGRQDFDALGQRIHPAESRIRMLAEKTPTRFVAFDVLSIDDDVLLELPQHERRARLERLIDAPVDLTPVVFEPDGAQEWLQGAEGVIAKQLEAPYRPGERMGMMKIKRVRTIDAVVMGWRPGKEEGTVGSFILGLHDERGVCGRSATPPASAPRRSASCRPSWRPTRPASAEWATPAVGPTTASSSGSSCVPSWSSRSRSTTRATTASATEPSSPAGARTRRRRTAGWTNCSSRPSKTGEIPRFGGARGGRSFGRAMPSYLIETYLPRSRSGELPAVVDRLRRATESLAAEGAPVRHLRSTFLPGDELCLHLFEAESAATVERGEPACSDRACPSGAGVSPHAPGGAT